MVAGVLEVEGPGHEEMAGYGRSETCPTLAELALPAPALSSRGGKDRRAPGIGQSVASQDLALGDRPAELWAAAMTRWRISGRGGAMSSNSPSSIARNNLAST